MGVTGEDRSKRWDGVGRHWTYGIDISIGRISVVIGQPCCIWQHKHDGKVATGNQWSVVVSNR